MSYQVLARKWRPRDFSEVVGQSHVVRALSNALDADRLHHAFLFTGTRGVGKTTLARILAKCLNCESGVGSTPCGQCSACREIDEGRFIDLLEVDAASRSKVEETRELMDNVQFSPTRGRYKVYLIDEVHMFSEKSFNALLKTLEEPPPHVKFLLATTDPQKLPVTVLSRCLQFNLKRLPTDEIAGHLSAILAAEQVEADANAVRRIAKAADGSMRDSLSLLDQAIAYGGGRLQHEEVRAMLGTLDQVHLFNLLDALAAGDPAELLGYISDMATDVTDFSEALAELVAVLHRIASLQAVPDLRQSDSDDDARCAALSAVMAPEDVQLYYQIGVLSRRDLPLAPDPRSGFEMALLRMLAFRPAGADTPSAGGGGTAGSGAPSRVAREASAPHEAPATATPPAAGRSDSPPATIRAEHWHRIITELSLTGLTRELANNCTVGHADEHRVTLILAPGHEQLASGKVKQKLEAALQRYCASHLELRIEIDSPAGETPADIIKRKDSKRHQEAVAAIEADPVVRTICDTFDATYSADAVRPSDS